MKILVEESSSVADYYNAKSLWFIASNFDLYQSTVGQGGSVIMAKIFGVFGTKTCSFIKENRTKNGPLVFRTVLCSKHDEKLGN